MKEIKSYECDYCHDYYETKEECRKCEKSHIEPVKISESVWTPKDGGGSAYPEVIFVEMSNGEIVTYSCKIGD